MARKRQTATRRLRKQPKMRRIQSASAIAMPRVTVPETARRRRRRNRRRVHVSTAVVKTWVFSARWISLGLLTLTIYALVSIGMNEHFFLKVIPIEGNVSIPAAEIVKASGLASTHIFAADPNQAAARINAVPGVISAAVTLTWPNQVLIQVKEESPIAIWQEGGRQYWITEDGRLIPARGVPPGLLILESEIPPRVLADEETEPQASIPFVPKEVLDGARQLQTLRPNIEKLYYRPAGGLSYQDGRGWRAYFGAGNDMHQKLVVYETIVEDLLARGLKPVYISVSNQKRPFYRLQ